MPLSNLKNNCKGILVVGIYLYLPVSTCIYLFFYLWLASQQLGAWDVEVKLYTS
jgi:hypothetical protein